MKWNDDALFGSAKPEDYKSFDENGQPLDLGEAVFPILKYESNSQWKLVGTGFFILPNGIFLTAKHVLMDIIDDNGEQKCPASILQITNNNYYLRNIIAFQIRGNSDVAFGITAQFPIDSSKCPLNKVLILNTTIPNINEPVCTYAYPSHRIINDADEHTFHFNPQIYDGIITDHFPKYRDLGLVNFPCYETSMVLHGGASGGPVFNEHGYVIGINSIGMQNAAHSYIARIIDTFDLELKNLNIEGVGVVSKTIRQLMLMDIVKAVKKKSEIRKS